MSSARRKVLRKAPTVNIGCSCSRRKLSHLFSPKPTAPKTSAYQKPELQPSSPRSADKFPLSFSVSDFSSSSSTVTLSSSSPRSPGPYFKSVISGGPSVQSRIGDSVAVVKDSDDPFLDFQHSILQMIVEKEIYAKDDLRRLLHCFLSLNSPYHHDIIIRAFSDIWSAVFSASRLASTAPPLVTLSREVAPPFVPPARAE